MTTDQQAADTSEYGGGSGSGSGSSGGRRSIFSPEERSRAAQSGTAAARDLTRSARVRAVRLGGTTAPSSSATASAAASASPADGATSAPSKAYVQENGGVDADTSPPDKPGYVGQRTSKRLSPSTHLPTNDADADDGTGGGSPGAWALRHARELASTDDDMGQLGGEQLVWVPGTNDNKGAAAEASDGVGSSSGRALPPRPAATANNNGRATVGHTRDLSFRSRADSEGGDTLPMSNRRTRAPGSNASGADDDAETDSASSLNALSQSATEEEEYGEGTARVEVELLPGLFGSHGAPTCTGLEDDTPKASNLLMTNGPFASPKPSWGKDGGKCDDGKDPAELTAPVPIDAAIDLSGKMSPVSPVTPGDRDRYGSLQARGEDTDRRAKLDAHQIDNVSKLGMDDVLDPDRDGGPPPQPTLHAAKHHVQPDDPTLHLQSLLLAVAFLFVWSPQNLMAPNLTEMADFFGFTPEQRDLFLGAYVAFATGVLSLPVSAAIGFVADLVPSRKRLYAWTCLVGGAAAILTGVSQSYAQLYFARFVCGGCMSGSVPIAFSLLGDLFDTKDRNAASAGLTAMMGAGILFGQVYAGCVGSQNGWRGPFYLSGTLTILSSLLVLWFVKEPVRGGKEKVLQDMLASGTKYEKKLTLEDFMHAILRNQSNALLIWFGFFTSIPWGVIFTFLNDYLSQEQSMSVPDATMLVLWFGIGCALGGILGGYLGQLTMTMDRSYLPLFMAASTFLGMFPFLALLNGPFHTAGILPCFYALVGGCVANLPSVNMRPCIINVNAPEVRGASLNASNIAINLARGAGPSCITIMSAIWGVSRQFSFNVTIIVFWTISAAMLGFLAKTLPHDQDAMETELARYAETALGGKDAPSVTSEDSWSIAGDISLMSIEERAHFFDARAAEQSLMFLGEAFKEVEIVLHRNRDRRHQSDHSVSSSNEDMAVRRPPPASSKSGSHDHRRTLWRRQQLDRQQNYESINEETELMVEYKSAPHHYRDAELG